MFDKIDNMIQGISDFASGIIEDVVDVLMLKADDLADQVRKQMLAGQTADGSPFVPGYNNDPWFRSDRHREGYLKFKELASGLTLPASGAPNFYITGVFHSSIVFLYDGDDAVCVESTFKNGDEIFNKWGIDNFLPNQQYMEEEIIPVEEDVLQNKLRYTLAI